ncbi:MFS transporter [Kytococcus schroeteri]|uniref:MFS transporter n=1 Tax=Kytococcus schroeteri TaxID=138300 RepID=UPI001144D4DE|nr:MFS transporter [Kytococcus schroeteri]
MAHLPRYFWPLFAAQFINRVASFAQPFLVLYLTEGHGVAVSTAGAVAAAVGVGSVVATVLGGWAADRLGRRATMLVAQALTSASLLWLALAHGLWQLWAAALLVGVGGELLRPAMSATVGDTVPEALQVRAYGLLFWALNLGFAVATVSAGLLTRWGYPVLFLVNAAASALAGAVIWWGVRETRPTATPRTTHLLPVLWRDHGTQLLLVAGTLYSVVYFQAYSTLPVVMAGQGISAAAYGAVIAVNGVVICVVQPVAVRWIEQWPAEAVYAAGLAVLGGGFALTSLVDDVVGHALVIATWTLGEILTAGVAGALFARRAPVSLRGRYLGLMTMTFALGSAVGPFVGTSVLDHLGATWLWTGCGLAGLVGAAVMRHVARAPRVVA